MTDLSILNLAPLRDGETFNQAIDNLVELAQLPNALATLATGLPNTTTCPI